MLTLLGARPRDLVTIEPSDEDWYSNLLWLDARKCLLFAHAGTLFSVFVPDGPIGIRSDLRMVAEHRSALRLRQGDGVRIESAQAV
jgi:hypothetical protein